MPSAKPPSSGARPRVQSQYSRNRLDRGSRARVYKPKGPSRSHLKLDNTRRTYRFVTSKLFSCSKSSDALTDHSVIMARRNMSTSLALGSRPLVRSQPIPLHFRTCSRFHLTTFPLLRQVLAIVASHACTNTTQPRSQYAGLSSKATARIALKLVLSHMTQIRIARLYVCTLQMPVAAHAQIAYTLMCM